ncbi:MAG: hypothetical protein L3J06_03375 [Cyclobacteriaceae bacterium]|nr:hypothetical protein [Cyclobacteriaceae bacterium]
MDLQAEKAHLIQWLAEVNDLAVIKQFKALQKSNQEQVSSFTSAEKSAIDQGLKSIEEGKVHTHESVMQSTKEKHPNLFK